MGNYHTSMTDKELQEWKLMSENPETVYVSKEDYDTLVRAMNEPPNPEVVKSLKKLLSRAKGVFVVDDC